MGSDPRLISNKNIIGITGGEKVKISKNGGDLDFDSANNRTSDFLEAHLPKSSNND